MNFQANGEERPDDLWQVHELAEALGGRYEQLLAVGDADGARAVLDEIVGLLEQALDGGDAAHPVWHILMTMAIEGHSERLGLTGDPADRNETIRLLGRYLNGLMTPADGVVQVPGMSASDAYLQLALLLGDRYSDQRGPERDGTDLDLAVAHAREAVRLGVGADTPAGDAADIAAGQHAVLGLLLTTRYGDSLGGPDNPRWADGQEAITELRLARAGLTDPDDPDICGALGNLLADRYFDQWPGEPANPSDRDDALSMLTVAAQAEELDTGTLVTLAELADSRLTDTSDRTDREVAIKWGELLLSRLEPQVDDALAALTHGSLGLALKDRAEYAPDPKADLKASIAHLEAELELTPPGEPDRRSQLALLAGVYLDYVDGDESQYAAVDRMTELAIEAWPLTPPATDERALIGVYLATGFYARLARPGRAVDIAEIVFAMDVLAEIEPQFDDDPEFGRTIVVMMMTLTTSYAQIVGSAQALAQAEPWIMRAIEEIPADDPQWPVAALVLSGGLLLLATNGLSAEMTEKAIEVLSAVLRQPGIDAFSVPRIEGALGIVLVQRSGMGSGPADLDQGIVYLRAYWEAVHDDNSERAAVAMNLGSALMVRYMQRGDRQDLDAARWYVAAVRELASERPAVKEGNAGFDAVAAGMAGITQVLAGQAEDDVTLMDAGIADLRSAIAALPPGSPLYTRLRNDLGLALFTRLGIDPAGVAQLDEIVDLLQGSSALSKGSLMRPMAIARLAGVLMAKGVTTSDPAPIGAAIELLTDLLDELGPDYYDRIRFTGALGILYKARFEMTTDPADIKAAVRWLEQSREDLEQAPGHSTRGTALMSLARCYRLGGALASARETGLAALRERGQDVLLQTGTARGLGYAKLAASEAAEVADWCLADGEPRAAVAALELGRSLVLHASTVVTSVAELLDEVGQTELATRWRAFVAASPLDKGEQPWDVTDQEGAGGLLGLAQASARIPDDLRVRVLGAIAGAGATRLTDSPSSADIATAVAETGADALVYLLEPVSEATGYAVILPAEPSRRGEVDVLELPSLARGTSGRLDGYIAAYTDWVSGVDNSEKPWRLALEELCDWAWPTVMGPLLDRVGGWEFGRVPRLVLVPAGRLSVVPWQAARSATGPGQGRFACSDAVISYAASGRLLIEVSRRPSLDLQAAPVIVGDPAHRLPGAAAEAEAIAAGCYPAGRYLGRVQSGHVRRVDGRGTPAELLAELPAMERPGASVLHLGCDGWVERAAPPMSYLELADGEHLTIETILRQAGGRPPQAPGGLVSLAACLSDYGVATYDEALSLATAFLAGGAVTVTSARWFIDDDLTTLLMFMFHYFMTARDQSPRDALRLAQLWMLDADRTAPSQMPPELARDVASLGSIDVADWAAFTHQGR